VSQNRRQHIRVVGPFDGTRLGLLDLPVRIYDLSVGGCFINSFDDSPRVGRSFPLMIELPGETFTVQCETLYSREGFGYAVKFVDLPADTRARLEKIVMKLHAQAQMM
jgi:hypothetical protein